MFGNRYERFVAIWSLLAALLLMGGCLVQSASPSIVHADGRTVIYIPLVAKNFRTRTWVQLDIVTFPVHAGYLIVNIQNESTHTVRFQVYGRDADWGWTPLTAGAEDFTSYWNLPPGASVDFFRAAYRNWDAYAVYAYLRLGECVTFTEMGYVRGVTTSPLYGNEHVTNCHKVLMFEGSMDARTDRSSP